MDLAQCAICQELFEFKNDDLVAGFCGHVFHFTCISQWRTNSDTCPQCRTRYAGREPVKLYFDMQVATDCDASDPAVLQNKVRDLHLKVEEKDKEIKDHKGKVKAAKKELKGVKLELGALRRELDKCDTVNSALKHQLSFLEKHKEEAVKSRQTAERLQRNLDRLQNVEILINGEKEDVETMLKKFNNSSESMNQVVTSFVIMKKEFEKLKESKERMHEDKKVQRKELDELRRKIQNFSGRNKALQDQLRLAETDLQHMEKERQSLLSKVNSLELAFASTSPRTNLIRRLLKESPAPLSAKRKRRTPFDDAEDDENSEQTDEVYFDMGVKHEELLSDSFHDLANEIGLKVVTTTSVATRAIKPGKLDGRKALTNIKCTTNQNSTTASSSCPVVQRGYNGLGGQSRFLKPSNSKNLSRKVKVPKSSNMKALDSDYFMPKKQHPLPHFDITP